MRPSGPPNVGFLPTVAVGPAPPRAPNGSNGGNISTGMGMSGAPGTTTLLSVAGLLADGTPGPPPSAPPTGPPPRKYQLAPPGQRQLHRSVEHGYADFYPMRQTDREDTLTADHVRLHDADADPREHGWMQAADSWGVRRPVRWACLRRGVGKARLSFSTCAGS